MEEKTFPCTSEGLAASQAFLETLCDSPKPAIVLDEIASNIVRCSRASGFTLALDRTDDALIMVFSDDGVAFDPTRDTETPDVGAAIEDRQIGGLGIFMVKKMAKSVAYARRDGKNVLTVVMGDGDESKNHRQG